MFHVVMDLTPLSEESFVFRISVKTVAIRNGWGSIKQ